MATRKPKTTKTITPIDISLGVQYQAKEDMHTLKRAHEIERDSKRMMNARKEALTEAKKLQAITARKRVK